MSRNFAEDYGFNAKKDYFVAIVKSLKDIGGKKGPSDGETNRAGSLSHGDARVRAGVTEYIPEDPKVAASRLSSKEIRGMIKGNCGLIKTVDPDKIAGIERRVKRIYEGTSRPDTLERYLEKECDLEPWQAERIVKDQMLKYEAKARIESMRKGGVRKVRWVHGTAKDPRPWHNEPYPYGLDGGVFDIDDPPVIDPDTGERGWPGDLIGCTCHLEPAD